MADVTQAVTATKPTKAPRKKSTKAKAPADHPKYSVMVKAAIAALKERGGSSRQALLKYIIKNYKVGNDEKKVNTRVKVALRAGIKSGSLKQAKGTGSSGSFKLAEKAAKPKVAKPKTSKKAKTPKKPKAAKSPKKTTASKPKLAKKPKAAVKPKSATKKPAKPKTAKKPAKPKAAKKSAKPKTVKVKKPKAPKAAKTPKA